jgi:predicted nucleic acid-binding protein
MILVDTSVWIDFLKGENSPERRMLHELIQNEEDLSLTGIVLTEILQGIREGKQLNTTRKYLLEFPIFEPKGITTYTEAARIFGVCRKKGRIIRSTVDCLIAAICLENDLPVFYRDRDFDIIQECTGLKELKAQG